MNFSPHSKEIYPPSFLGEVLVQKRREIEKFKSSDVFPQRLRRAPPSLFNILKKPGPRFIFECKKASPGKGIINLKCDYLEMAKIYSGFSDAISVLTDETFFRGSLDDLRTLAKATDKPLLAKDFFIHSSQINRAFSAGADAILLILKILTDSEYRHLFNHARKLGLNVITEVKNEAEVKRANALKAPIVGINNRNLETLSIDLKTTEKLAPLVWRGAVIISESGFSNRSQILKAAPYVNGFLIGSSVMGSKRPDLKIRELVFGEIKVCGIMNSRDARFAYDNGAIYGGLNFVYESPRFVDSAAAKEFSEKTPLKLVGVFRNSDPFQIAGVSNFLGLEAVQLHGDETANFRKLLRRFLPNKTAIWQAVDGSHYDKGKFPRGCDKVLLDTCYKNVFGGTGRTFPWGPLKRLKHKRKLVISGGINAENIQEAFKTGIPLIDVCSGLEATCGVKSEEKIKTFFMTCRTIRRGK